MTRHFAHSSKANLRFSISFSGLWQTNLQHQTITNCLDTGRRPPRQAENMLERLYIPSQPQSQPFRHLTRISSRKWTDGWTLDFCRARNGGSYPSSLLHFTQFFSCKIKIAMPKTYVMVFYQVWHRAEYLVWTMLFLHVLLLSVVDLAGSSASTSYFATTSDRVSFSGVTIRGSRE